jgi:hypothetical protein
VPFGDRHIVDGSCFDHLAAFVLDPGENTIIRPRVPRRILFRPPRR